MIQPNTQFQMPFNLLKNSGEYPNREVGNMIVVIDELYIDSTTLYIMSERNIYAHMKLNRRSHKLKEPVPVGESAVTGTSSWLSSSRK